MLDRNSELPEFLQDVYYFEEKYPYLDKVYDSKDSGLKYHIKLFKINYEKYDLIMD